MSLQYTLKEGIAGFRKQKLAALGSILTITFSLLLLGFYYILSVNVTGAVQTMRSKVDMEAFVKEPVLQDRLIEIQKQLKAIAGIDSIDFVSKNEAAEIFKQDFGEDIKKVLDFNPLPPSFKITLQDSYRTSEQAEAIQKSVKAIKGVDDVVYRRDMLQFLDRRTKNLNNITLIAGIILCVVSILLVSNTIRLTIVSRKQVIQTMKLVGATRWFIRAPFLIEGILYGFIGGFFAASALYYFMTVTKEFIPGELLSLVIIQPVYYVYIITAGIILGLFGSLVSARKYIGESVV